MVFYGFAHGLLKDREWLVSGTRLSCVHSLLFTFFPRGASAPLGPPLQLGEGGGIQN